jgi:hypothetical protein
MDEALGACAKSCCAGCPHTAAHGQSHTETHAHVELADIASIEAAA